MDNRPRVLFVDDEQRVLNSMRGMFRRDFDLFLTTEGASAIRIAAANPIDVIVADQRMPGMSGVELLDIVKRLSPNTIRILLTGYADPTAIEGSINVGEVFRFLSKPCSPKVLRETLKLAVQASQAAVAPPPRRLESTPERHTPAQKRGARVFDTDAITELPVLQLVQSVGPGDPVQSAIERAREVGVVVYTVDSVFAETAIRTISSERNTMLATSLIKAMQALERDSSGILITDITTDFARLHRIIGALKQHVPDLVTIVVSDTRDSNNMVSLINYGQVFRYELKPVAPKQLRVDINAAAIKHVTLRNDPSQENRHSVEELPLDTSTTSYERDLGAIVGLRERRGYAMNVQP